MERITILQRETHLGLHQQARHHEHARLHWGCTHKISTPQTSSATTHPLQSNNHPLWSKGSEGGRRQISPPHDRPIKRIQKIVGTLLYYGRAVDSTLLTALSAITARQSNGTQAVAEACHQLLDYVATHPNAGIRYHACDMILTVHTDASYLSELGGKSRAAGHFYLTNQNDEDFNNGAILTLSSIIKHVMSFASEAELAALYYGCKQAAPIRVTLKEMGHPQPAPTPVTTDNITAQGLTMGTMTPKASKSNDQRFNWLKCCNAQCQFKYLWRKGILNRADYTSKHHPARHRQNVQKLYVFDSDQLPEQ